MEYGLGVDLGTTHTAAAVRVGQHVEVVRLASRRPEIPSLVFVGTDGGVLIGEAAERRGAGEPGRLAREFKRRVGDPVPLLVGGSPYSAHALMARLLGQVLETVTAQQEAPPGAVVVTHPANWGPYKRELLDQAVRLAGLADVQFRSEPEAAAIQYAAHERVRPDEIVAVYDLGGGTFDAAVLRKTAGGFEVLGEPEGIEQLGGIDFDEAVFGHTLATLGTAAGSLDPEDEAVTTGLARLRRDCVEAKEALSYDTEVMIPVALPGLHTRVRLNRSEFERMIAPALGDTVGAMRRALGSAGVDPQQLRSVLLAGGSSRIPLVGQLLTAEFGRPVVLDPHPEHSIAIGAALATGPLPTPAEPVEEPPTVETAPAGGTVPVVLPGSAGADTTGPVPAATASGAENTTVRLPAAGPPPWRRARRALLVTAALVLVGAVLGTLAALRVGRDADDGGSPPDQAAATGTATPSPPATTAPASACAFADEFTGNAVDPQWERVSGAGGFVVAGGSIELTAPNGSDIYQDQLRAPMLLRVPAGDFSLETDVTVSPRQFYQGAGLVLWNGSRSYVRLERGYGDVGAIAFEYRDGDDHQRVHAPFRENRTVVRTNANRVLLRLTKTAKSVTARWRPFEDQRWRDLGSIPIAMPNYTKAGVAVLNRAQGTGSRPATMTASFEYVRVTCP